MNIALFSVIHPNALPYFNEFLNSLANQTHKDFTLFLVNDGVSNIEEIIHRFDFNIILKNIGGTPSAVRKAGIEWVLLQGADIIIFADTDDYFMDNRIEISQSILAQYDIVFNELMIIGKNIQQPFPMLEHRFKEGAELSIDNIKYSNCMGFSNTAINTKCVTKSFSQVPDDIIAFDWAFFLLCLHEGTKAVFTKQTATYYRQYENNIASPQSFTEDQLMRGVQVKRNHYRFILRFVNKYESISKEFDKLFEKLNTDTTLRAKYCHEVKNQSPPSPLWWESIKTLEELGL
ncbi:MAG: glycosyltransferase [Kiritimatiellae bacterium]|nr:glycosyltransferase [Verrucomicrobiota bacterium]MCG2680935.1 glycosyltransferase [Kiritimatiellia bacterium]